MTFEEVIRIQEVSGKVGFFRIIFHPISVMVLAFYDYSTIKSLIRVQF